MKYSFISIWVLLFTSVCQGQEVSSLESRKGQVYFYWGWNWDWHSKSDIRFHGDTYDFTLQDVEATDRRTKFDANTYLNPANATIPQYNFRVGYFFRENFNISFGIDHMKYVVRQNQQVQIDGFIHDSDTEYNGDYNNDQILIQPNFLLFEHTDGLNFGNIEIRHFLDLLKDKKIKIGFTQGVGAGIILPRTNTTLLNNERYDQFHLSGYGVSGVVGIQVNYFKSLFIQSEFKGGYINMPDIRTSNLESDRASQHFFFSQLNIVFGASIRLL